MAALGQQIANQKDAAAGHPDTILSLLPKEERPFTTSDDTVLGGEPTQPQIRGRATADQIRALYQRSGTELVTGLLVSAMAGVVLWDRVPADLLTGWLVAVVVIYAVRGLLLGVYNQALPTVEQAPSWGRRYATGSLLAGLAWGASGLLPAFYGDLVHQVFMLFMLGGVSLSAYVSMVTSIRTFTLFVIPTMLPITVWFAVQGDDLHLSMAALALMSSGLMLASCRGLNNTLVRSQSLASNNAELVRRFVTAKDHLEQAKSAAERTNIALQEEIKERQRIEKKIRQSERQLSSILHNMHDTIYRTDMDGKITWISPSVRRLLGYTAEELAAQPMQGLFASKNEHANLLLELENRNGVIDNFELRMARKDGTKLWVATNCHHYYDDEGRSSGLEGTLRDVTARRLAEEALFQEKERAQVTLESIGDGVITTDIEGQIEYMNPVAELASGWFEGAARGLPILSVLQLADENTEEPVPDPVHQCMQAKQAVRVSGHPLLVHRDNGQAISVELITAPIRDSDNNVIGAVLIFHDVTELRGLARQMSHQAIHDALTGLINRREFERRASQLLDNARLENEHHALCYLDLDQFKVVNDTCGHTAGDELLKQLTARLKTMLRESDTLARLGGDEFGVLLQGCSVAKASDLAEEMRRVVEDFRFGWEDQSFRVGVSIGLAPITSMTANLSELLSAADSACYVAKDHGRNRVHVFQPDDQALAERHGQMQWMQRIQRALERDQFRLYFQPIVHLQESGKQDIHGEIVVRLLGDDGKIVDPGAFIPAAERYQQMTEIDRWVIKNTFKQLSEKHPMLEGISTCSVNLSGQSLSDDKFLDFIMQQVRSRNVPAERLCFEITETAVIANLSNATDFIAELRQMGCRFALDDFGSGLSSFAYLKNLPVDFLKIDGSFIRTMKHNNIDRAMVRAINQIGHVMRIETIAECVEDNATLEILRRLGIDYAQGFGIGEPLPLDTASD